MINIMLKQQYFLNLRLTLPEPIFLKIKFDGLDACFNFSDSTEFVSPGMTVKSISLVLCASEK